MVTMIPSSRARLAAKLLWIAAVAVAGCGGSRDAAQDRDPRWAGKLDRRGLPNLAEIEPGLYRGAQPEPEGFGSLREMGVRTIVNLRTASSDPAAIRAAGLPGDAFAVVEIPMVASRPELGKARDFLAIAADASRRPLFFHCLHGADRTGAMAAAYRVVVQGWKAEDAVAEMTEGGFGFHPVFRGLPEFVTGLDAKSLRAAIGLAP
jgi:hypothetical protein